MNTNESFRYFAPIAVNRRAGAIAGANPVLSTQVAGWLVGRLDIAGCAGEGRLSIDLRGLGAHEHDS